MALDPSKKHNDQKDKMQKERRGFLKKAVYTAPTLALMGQLVRPAVALGGSGDDTNDGPGGGFGGFGGGGFGG